MKKPLAFIFLIFFSLAAIDCFCSFLVGALSSFPLTASGQTFNSDQTSGLTSINLSLFTKGSTARNYITQGYGRTPYSYLYPNDWHDGIDIAASYGAPIYSPNDGVVIAIGDQDNYCYHRGFGKYVAVEDQSNNLVLWYAHLGTIDVTSGETISKNTELGTVGATGLETGTHLHFSIFDADGFTMQSRNGCGPEPTGQDLNPFNYIGTTYK